MSNDIFIFSTEPEARAFCKEHSSYSPRKRADGFGWSCVPQVNEISRDGGSKFDLIPAGEFVKGGAPAHLIKGVLHRAGLGTIFGPPGSGKSVLAFDMACAISRGVQWCGHRVRKGRVAYLLAEGSGGFRKRVAAYAKHHDVSHADLPFLISDVPDLKSPEDTALLVKKIGKADLLVVDTFAAAFIGNENTSEDVNPVLAHCKFISQKTGAFVLLICHTGKDESKGVRGWSGLHAAFDTEIQVVSNGERRAASIVKQKDGEEGPLINFCLQVVPIGTDSDGDPVTGVVLEESAAEFVKARKVEQFLGSHQQAIRKALLQMGGQAKAIEVRDTALRYVSFDPDDLQEAKATRSNLKKALDKCIDKGLVHIPEEGVVAMGAEPTIKPLPPEEQPELILDIGGHAAFAAAMELE